MPKITFIHADGNIEITASTSYASKYYEKALGQSYKETGEGTLVVKNSIPKIIVKSILVFKDVDYSDGELLRTWIRDTIIFREKSFNMSSDNVESDLGAGKNVDLVDTGFYEYRCNLSKSDDKGIFNHKAPKRYDIKFPYDLVILEIVR